MNQILTIYSTADIDWWFWVEITIQILTILLLKLYRCNYKQPTQRSLVNYMEMQTIFPKIDPQIEIECVQKWCKIVYWSFQIFLHMGRVREINLKKSKYIRRAVLSLKQIYPILNCMLKFSWLYNFLGPSMFQILIFPMYNV